MHASHGLRGRGGRIWPDAARRTPQGHRPSFSPSIVRGLVTSYPPRSRVCLQLFHRQLGHVARVGWVESCLRTPRVTVCWWRGVGSGPRGFGPLSVNSSMSSCRPLPQPRSLTCKSGTHGVWELQYRDPCVSGLQHKDPCLGAGAWMLAPALGGCCEAGERSVDLGVAGLRIGICGALSYFSAQTPEFASWALITRSPTIEGPARLTALLEAAEFNGVRRDHPFLHLGKKGPGPRALRSCFLKAGLRIFSHPIQAASAFLLLTVSV